MYALYSFEAVGPSRLGRRKNICSGVQNVSYKLMVYFAQHVSQGVRIVVCRGSVSPLDKDSANLIEPYLCGWRIGSEQCRRSKRPSLLKASSTDEQRVKDYWRAVSRICIDEIKR